MHDSLAAFNDACAAQAIHSAHDFAAHFGRRLCDLSLAKALAIITSDPSPPDPHFPPRFGAALYHPSPPMTREEQNIWRARWIANAVPPLTESKP